MPSLVQLEVFLLIVGRIAGLIARAPMISGRGIPNLARASLVIFLSVVLWFVVPLPARLPATMVTFLIALLNEVLLGFLIGFICYLIASVFQTTGEIMDLQMGLSVSKTLDPTFGTEISLIGRLTYYFGILLFLLVNGHHLMFSALNTSFSLFPVGSAVNYSLGMIDELIKVVSDLWLVSIQLAAPALLMIFLADFSFGMVSRVAPQVNVFMLGFQVKPLIGIYLFLAVLPLFAHHLIYYINQLLPQLLRIFGFMGF
jgi:flagellar biosynthetic protein FliR